MSKRLADFYEAQTRRVLEAGGGGRTIQDRPVDLEPPLQPTDARGRWFTSTLQRLPFPQTRRDNPPPAFNHVCLRLHVSKEDDTTPSSAEQLLISLGGTPAPIAFEVKSSWRMRASWASCLERSSMPPTGIIVSWSQPKMLAVDSRSDASREASITRSSGVLMMGSLGNASQPLQWSIAASRSPRAPTTGGRPHGAAS